MDEKELERRVAQMTDEEQALFKQAIYRLAMCFGEDAWSAVLVVRGHLLGTMSEVMQFNCNDMTACEILHDTTEYIDFLNIKDAPPKESFN
jgi:hypothetical protein